MLKSTSNIENKQEENKRPNNTITFHSLDANSDRTNLNEDKGISHESINFNKFADRLGSKLQKLEELSLFETEPVIEDIKICNSLYYNFANLFSIFKISCCFDKEKINLLKEAKKEYLNVMNFTNIFPKFSTYDYFLAMFFNDSQLKVLKNKALNFNRIK